MVIEMVYPKVEETMKKMRLKVPELAEAIGVPNSTLYDKLNGKSAMSVVMAQKIRNMLETDDSIEELFGAESTPADTAPAAANEKEGA